MNIALVFASSFILTTLFYKLFKQVRSIIPFGIICGFLFLGVKQLFSVDIPASSSVIFDILLAYSFSSMALEAKSLNIKNVFKYNDFWFYSILQFISQWILILGLTYIMMYFFDVPSYLGSLVPIGFAGGYGSAAAAGNIFLKSFNVQDIYPVFMFSSTIGILLSIIGAVFLVNRKGEKFRQDLSHIPSPNELSIPGVLTISALVVAGFAVSFLIQKLFNFYVPSFTLSYVLGHLFKNFLVPKTTLDDISFSSYYSSEFLIIFGIGLINLKVIELYLAPILIYMSAGLLLCLFMYFVVAKRILKRDVFERSIFTWGWSVGGIIIALSIIHSLKSDKAHSTLQEYMQIYLFIAPFEIALLFLTPWLLIHGYIGTLIGILLTIGIFFWHFIYKKSSKHLIS